MKKMNYFKKVALVIPLTFFMMVLMISPLGLGTKKVSAQAAATGNNLLCQIFPFIGEIGFTKSLCGGGKTEESARTTVELVMSLVKFAVSIVFIGIIIIAVYTIIKAALVYIRSGGDEGKIQESQKAIKAVFVGIGALIVGVIGLVIVLVVFRAGGAVGTSDDTNPIDVLLGGCPKAGSPCSNAGATSGECTDEGGNKLPTGRTCNGTTWQ